MIPESIDDVMKKRESFSHMWKLLEPAAEFNDLYTLCMKRWNMMSYRSQQQVYWFIREKKRRGETIYKNPLFALTYTRPFPNDWNGKPGIGQMMAQHKMVSACYNGNFGIYTQLEATIFEMTHVKPLN